jgi:hypothetical protein
MRLTFSEAKCLVSEKLADNAMKPPDTMVVAVEDFELVYFRPCQGDGNFTTLPFQDCSKSEQTESNRNSPG